MQTVQEINTDERLLKLAAEIDEFEGYAHPHATRIAALADEVAKKFHLSPHDRYSLRQAALVHDIGEVLMNRDYIKAKRVLRDDERIDMQRHTVIGEQEAAKRGLSRAVQLLVRWHHEWWSGAGYPDALERDLIPLAARILRVCDTYAAMTDARPYSAAIPRTEAKKYLTEWAGIEFDPSVVKAFLNLEGLRELESFDVWENNQSPEPLNSNAPEAPPTDAREDFSGDKVEQNSPYKQFWGDDN
ncbi:MAG TPA: HD domain-containing phosphohydrolase [Pyrinomonadaceae bacterium]|jgi:HD-GYP domain-containing protein (c-di-GMP phosphodiesterase class II)